MTACLDCGKPYSDFPLDATLPDEQWRMIHDSEGGLLCANCMVARLAKLPGAIAVRMRLEFAKEPPYEPSEAEVEAAAIEMGWTQYIGLGWEGFKTAAEYWAGIPAETRTEHLRVARAALIAADKARLA